MNIEKMREEFEAWVVKYSAEKNYNWPELVLNRDDGDGYVTTWVDSAWIGWQASRESLVPAWHQMLEEPPFPFTGDIFVGGKVVIGAAWCSGYWQAVRGGCVERSSVTHWKSSNPSVIPPEV